MLNLSMDSRSVAANTQPEQAPEAQDVFLSTAEAGRPVQRLALAVVLVSLVIFIIAAPFAKQPLEQVWAFLPIYQSALVINDLITASLLFGQVAIVHSRALMVLACGYLFCALMAIAHALSFPGLFSPTGLMGAGPQTTAWLYFVWHGVFPLAVIAYALLNDRPAREVPPPIVRWAVLAPIATVFAAVGLIVFATTAGHDLLPPIMLGNSDMSSKVFVASGTWLLCVAALALLWRRRQHTLLDTWLMVVMCTWIFDIALSSVLNGGRFDFGWYFGRVYGLAAGSFVLFVLLLENGMLFARLAEAYRNLGAVNRELEAFSYSVSHDLRAPLRAIDGYARMIEEDQAERLDDDGRRQLAVVREEALRMGRLIDGLLAFSKLGRQPIAATDVNSEALVDEILAALARETDTSRVIVVRTALPRVRGDQTLLRQVWANLISNAVKYSGKREAPRIEIGSYAEGGMHVFYVKDNGAGFNMKYRDKLFGVFQRGHDENEFPGTGVGLAIVQKLVTRHGGSAWAQGVVDAGATFYFSLPAGGPHGADGAV
jgi:signal transduction histidine kinase